MNRPRSESSATLDLAPRLRRLGRYEIEGELGRGSMGVVYRARDPIIDRVLAIKTVDPRLSGAALEPNEASSCSAMTGEKLALGSASCASFRERFLHEARAAGKLNHPCIVTIYDAGEADGVAYMAMELLEGATLRDLLCGVPLPVERALDITMQLAYALAYAHEADVVHRDVKPENVIVVGRRRVKLTDFGIASVTRMSDGNDDVAGSPKYMSPEQIRGENVDGRSDLFSLGVMLYEMLTAVQPFTGSDVKTIVREVTQVTPPQPSVHNPLVPSEIDALVMRMLAKDTEERVGSARRLYRELRKWLKARGAEIDDRDDRMDRLEPTVKRPSPGHDEPTLVLAHERGNAPTAVRFAWRRPALAGALVGVMVASAVAVWSLGEERAANANVIEIAAATESKAQTASSLAKSEPVVTLPAAQPEPSRTTPLRATLVAKASVRPGPPSAASSAQARTSRKGQPDVAVATSAEAVLPPSESVAAAIAASPPPPARNGIVRLAITPWGEVFIDGKFHGMTPPMDAVELPPGRHRLEIRNSLLPTYIADVRLDAGDTQHVRHRFE